MADFTQLADGVAQQNGADEDKTQCEAKSIANLFVKFMVQEQRILDLSPLRQKHVGKFADFLRFNIYKHYCKSARDEELTRREWVTAQVSCRQQLGSLDQTIGPCLPGYGFSSMS